MNDIKEFLNYTKNIIPSSLDKFEPMTEEEAIKGLINLFSGYELNLPYQDSTEVLYIAVKSIYKQIPVKPIYSEYQENEEEEYIPTKAICPFCEYEFEFGTWNDMENHHCICGQLMDWD